MTTCDSAGKRGSTVGGVGWLVRTDGPAVLVAATATIIVELGAFALARWRGAGSAAAMLTMLAVSTVWVAMASPTMAAGGQRIISSWLRGGVVADASAVALVVGWLAAPEMTFLAAVKVYCIFAAVCLAGTAVVAIGRTSAGRYALAVTVAVVLMIALASPVWLGGPAGYLGPDGRQTLALAAVRANPFFGVTAALSDSGQYVWPEMSVMYGMTALGDSIPLPPVGWRWPVIVYLAAAAAGLGASLLRRR